MFSIENLRKTFLAPGNVTVNAVDGISLGVETGKLITLLGPSGCGKTTTLRCLAGLERPESGRIVIANETMCDTDKGVFI
ncbi:MAG: iron(III) transport system ATP-binding protein, partial [Alphaproteobacteria bacterium]|nr:iron(III) transport system ATP-binding protein [Alphaproteobacteria bacterium]